MKKLLLLVVLVLATSLCGCSLLGFPSLNAPKPPDTTYDYNETFERNPTAVSIGDKIVVVEQQKRTVTAGYESKTKPLSWWQKLCNWLANVSIIIVLISIALLAFGIGSPFVYLYNRYAMAKKTLKGVVSAIDQAKTVEKDAELKATLSSYLDKDSKMLIDDIKRS